MFSVNKSNEKSFQISFDPQQHVISEDLILSHGPMARSSTVGKSWPRKVVQISGNPDENSSEKHKILKMMHREMEKQRRQEMRTLYFSLISLLPIEFIKGKRAMSDHINGAVSYIKQVSKKIKEEQARRDELIGLSNPCKLVLETEISKESSNYLSINPSNKGVQILISGCSDRFPLSRVLEELLQEGLDVVHCVSTQVNGSFIHSIQIEMQIMIQRLEELRKKEHDLGKMNNQLKYKLGEWQQSHSLQGHGQPSNAVIQSQASSIGLGCWESPPEGDGGEARTTEKEKAPHLDGLVNNVSHR